MQSHSDSRTSGMIYSATSRSHPSPYSRPPVSVPASETDFTGYYDDQFRLDQSYEKCLPPPIPRSLQDTLFAGSARSLTKHIGLHWNPTPSNITSMTTPPSSQSSFTSVSTLASETSGTTGNKSRQQVARRTQGPAPRRPTPDDFRSMVLFPHDMERLAGILDYVGTDSKYTLSRNYSAVMVRLSIKSQDIASKMHEVYQPLDAIDIFLGILLEYTGLRPEQKGCVSLRVCFGALTAVMGDSSQLTGVQPSASDPNAPVVPKEYLGQFRSFNPNLHDVLRRLSTKLEKSMNLYRHRRSPSGSLVAKFQEMSDTFDLWNAHLMDTTFSLPFQIASDWLKNHPVQVDNRRRNQAYNEQASPNLSDTTRPSPNQVDSNYLPPMNPYTEPSRSPNRANMRPSGIDAANQYDNLFRSSSSANGVTFFSDGPNGTGPFHVYRGVSAIDESLGLHSLENGAGMYAHPSHSSNTGPYQGTGAVYPGYN